MWSEKFNLENCALMVLIVLMKNVAKSTVFRFDEGWGGGRLKSEEKNSLSF